MAKFVTQSIPPGMQLLWEKHTSPAKATQGPNGVIKLKKHKKEPNKKPRPNLNRLAFKAIATTIAKEVYTDQKKGTPPDFVFNLTQDLILGIIDTKYFSKCKVESAVNLESTPTHSADLNPPPYGWRTQLFLPSIPAYPNGTVSPNPQKYTGQKIGGLFADTLLRWRKIVFKSYTASLPNGAARTLIKWDTTIHVIATSRGSRPMLSLNLTASLSPVTGGAVSSTTPPIVKKTTFYWRFKIPPSTPPYYNAYQPRREVRAGARIIKQTGTGPFARYVLNASNRPMMGRGFNNNDSIQTSFDIDPELWEIRQCKPGQIKSWLSNTATITLKIYGIAYSSKSAKYVACSQGGAWVSGDGLLWIFKDALNNAIYNDIAYSDVLDLFVMVGHNQGVTSIMTSQDGNFWTEVFPATGILWKKIAWSPKLGLFFAMGVGGATANSAWSTNGLSWTLSPAYVEFNPLGLIWVDELSKFIAVGNGGADKVAAISSDGVSVTLSAGQTFDSLSGVAWSPTLKLLVAGATTTNGYGTATSADGTGWAYNVTPSGDAPAYLTWCEDRGAFIASHPAIAPISLKTSTDGVSFSAFDPGTPYRINGCQWIEEACRLIAWGDENYVPKIIRSLDEV